MIRLIVPPLPAASRPSKTRRRAGRGPHPLLDADELGLQANELGLVDVEVHLLGSFCAAFGHGVILASRDDARGATVPSRHTDRRAAGPRQEEPMPTAPRSRPDDGLDHDVHDDMVRLLHAPQGPARRARACRSPRSTSRPTPSTSTSSSASTAATAPSRRSSSPTGRPRPTRRSRRCAPASRLTDPCAAQNPPARPGWQHGLDRLRRASAR